MAQVEIVRSIQAQLKEQLMADFNGQFWAGELSSSALSTAVAVVALAQVDDAKYRSVICDGLEWLRANVNEDGGWGDTVRSKSNLSTTLLCWSALALSDADGDSFRAVLEMCETWIINDVGSLDPKQLARAVVSHYGDDRTFSAPILTMLAICGRLGKPDEAWALIPQLPFELAIFPPSFFKWLGLPVVSYALPALIAVGLARYSHVPSFAGWFRGAVKNKVMKVLQRIQPSCGGFLEAPPLTAFVVMNLASAGHRKHDVVSAAVQFLENSVRDDGSWPIDTNLATWLTTLAVRAITPEYDLADEQRRDVRAWLLRQQYKNVHASTNASPGGWAWTDLPGGVPDADDTAGALLALRKLGKIDIEVRQAAVEGVKWLIDLQNRDGGMPTFCKGWGKLPFDRSCPDITAHAFAALSAWKSDLEQKVDLGIERACKRMLCYLRNTQSDEGSWLPLWFGNEHVKGHANPVYGTARVVTSLSAVASEAESMISAGLQYLLNSQNKDGGWGGASGAPSSIEETALALSALSSAQGDGVALDTATEWLVGRLEDFGHLQPAPIGLYFASLWYYEKLYPVVFSIEALSSLSYGWCEKDLNHL